MLYDHCKIALDGSRAYSSDMQYNDNDDRGNEEDCHLLDEPETLQVRKELPSTGAAKV